MSRVEPQVAASILQAAAALGKRLQEMYPTLESIGWDPKSVRSDMVERLQLEIGQKVSPDVLFRAFDMYLHGNPYTRLATPSYEGILPEERIPEIQKALSERYSERGRRFHDEGIGIHNRIPGDRKYAGRLGGLESAKATGKNTWYENDPLEPNSPFRYMLELAQRPEYRSRRRVRATKIAEALSERYGRKFTPHQVTMARKEHKDAIAEYQRMQWRSEIAQERHRRRGNHVWLTEAGSPTEELTTIIELAEYCTAQEIKSVMDTTYHHPHKLGSVKYALSLLERLNYG